MTDLDLTLAAVASHGWRMVLLGRRTKKPVGRTWIVTCDVNVIRRHPGNRGLLCGPESGVAVLDFDHRDLMTDMFTALGPLAVWVETGSGKPHCYVAWEPDLPAKVIWDGRKAGELQRGGVGPEGPVLQQVVLPPSVHPDTGRAYMWRIDPRAAVPALPAAWRAYLAPAAEQPLAPVPAPAGGDDGVQAWDGPSAEELLRRALQQPGARRRLGGVKFQCPGCRAEGHDRHKDNAVVHLDGRFGCAVGRTEHRVALAVALGVIAPPIPDVEMPGPRVVCAADLLDDWTGDF